MSDELREYRLRQRDERKAREELELAELLEEMAAALELALEVDRVPCGMGDAVRMGRSYLHARGRPPGQIVRFMPATDPELGLVE